MTRYNDIKHNDDKTNNTNINQVRNDNNNSNKDYNYDEIMTKINKIFNKLPKLINGNNK